MRRTVRRLLLAGLATGLFAAALLLGIYQASRMVPAFYRRALIAPPGATTEEGQQFERAALELHNQFHHSGRWEARLTQEQINGWLATDLPAKFPQALPSGVSEPRIAIEDGIVRGAVRYQRGGMDTVLSMAGEAYLTPQPNEIAIRVDQVRAGLVPIPLTRVLSEIDEQAARANLPLRWAEVRGTPVALIRLPLDSTEAGERRIVLDCLRCENGQVVVGGRTVDGAPGGDVTRPSTAVQPADKATRQR